MEKLFLLFLTLAAWIFIGCENEPVNPIDKETEAFKALTGIQFQGKVLDHDLNWVFNNWDDGIGAFVENLRCFPDDTSIHQMNFAIYDIEKRTHVTFIKMVSPASRITASYASKKAIFAVGEKPFRSADNSIFDGFIIEGVTKDTHFSTYYGPQENSSIEIVKVEELLPADPEQVDYKKIRIWTLITCDLYDCEGQKMGTIEQGRLISEIETARF